jgi:hypothetical protein
MATINAGNLTLLDRVKRTDPSGSIATIVESLQKTTPLLMDAVFREGNLPTGHRVSSRTALPSIGWRRFNEGVTTSKSRVDQFDEACGMMAGQSKVDVGLAKLNGDPAAFRASEDAAYVQAFRHELETGFFYHSTKTDPEKIMGLSPRLDLTTGPGGGQIIKHDGSASGDDQTSIWLVGWGDHTVYGITPKGSPSGLESKDMGEQLVADANGNTFRAYVTDWAWNVGLCVEDWRYLVRLANIDTGNLVGTGNTLILAMIRMIEEKLQDTSGCRPVFYVNRKIASYLRQQAVDSTKNSTLTIEHIGGQPVLMFSGIPVRRTDALLNTESPVT